MKSITLNLESNTDQLLSVRDYADVNIVPKPDSAALTFYVAQDHSGTVVGTVQVNSEDRRAIGALVGNWIAQGLAVQRMSYKAMNKLLRAQQKELDESNKPEKGVREYPEESIPSVENENAAL